MIDKLDKFGGEKKQATVKSLDHERQKRDESDQNDILGVVSGAFFITFSVSGF